MSPPIANEGPTDALVQAELDRIQCSDTFARAARHLRLLRHLVTATQAGDRDALREKTIAAGVLQRDPAHFDPQTDSIVRVEARRLRKRLAEYYADEGLDARLEFRIPTGSFAVEVLRRQFDPATLPRTSVMVFDPEVADSALAAAARVVSADLAGWLVRLNGLRVLRGGALNGPGADDAQASAHDAANRSAHHAARRAARRQGAPCLVVGSVAGDPPQLDLALLRTEDAALLWSRREALPQDAEGMLPLARSLVAALHREAAARRLQRVGPASSLPAAARGTSSELRDRMALARIALQGGDAEGAARAVTLAGEAAALDPSHAPALALLAEMLVAQAMFTAVPSRPALERARTAALAALEIDPDLASAHGTLGQICFTVDHDWARAEARLLAALRCAPGLAACHARYGWALMMNRRFDEARRAYGEARELEPDSVRYRSHEALIAVYERDWQRAAAGLDTVLEVAPDDLVTTALRAALCLYTGDIEGARMRYETLERRWPRLSIGVCGLAQTHALAGRDAQARERWAQLQAMSAQGWVSPYQLAMVCVRLRRPQAALDELGRSAELADGNFVCVGVDPAFDALRDEAGWRALLQRHGFAHLVTAGAGAA